MTRRKTTRKKNDFWSFTTEVSRASFISGWERNEADLSGDLILLKNGIELQSHQKVFRFRQGENREVCCFSSPFRGITNILYKSNSKVIFSQKYT